MSTYAELVRISEEELPGMGPYVLDKQIKDLGMEPDALGSGDIPGLAKAMSKVAAMFGEERARSMRKKILALMDRKNDLQGKSVEKRIEMLTDIGYSAYFSGEWDEALENLEAARELARKSSFSRTVIELDAKMARILSRKKDFRRASELIREAEKLLSSTHDRDLKAEILYEKGSMEWWSGNEEDALAHFKKALEISEAIGDHRLMGLAHMGMANTYSETGDVENDLYHSLEALKHFEKAESHEEIAKMYTNIGVTYEDLGNYMQAEDYYLRCVEYSRNIGYLLMESWAFLNLSELYVKMGDLYSAEIYAAHALEAYREMNDKLGVSLALERFAMIYSEKGEYERAEKDFEESIKLKEKYDTVYGLAVTLCSYASMLRKMGKNPEKQVSRAVKLFNDAGNSRRADECLRLISG